MSTNSVGRFKTAYCEGTIRTDVQDSADLVVFGKINEPVMEDVIRYVAASPPDYRFTFTGSGLPFANQDQAFYNTPNRGLVKLVDNTFEIKLMFPNSYYSGLGTVIIPPTLYVSYVDTQGNEKEVSIKLSEGIPYRMLSYPIQHTAPRKDAMFYSTGWALPVRTQEQVLRDSAYPSMNRMSEDFWGLKPPL